MNLVIKLIFFLSSKFKHYRVVISHWFWTKHFRGSINLETYKISDKPLNFVTDFKSKIVIDKNVNFAGSSKLLAQSGGTITIKNDCFFNTNCSINALKEIEIGSNTIFGESVKLYDHDHNISDKDIEYKNQGYSTSSIKIGNNVWLGSNVVILKGVKVGNNAVIAASSVVKSSIPANELWAGVPAKKIKTL